MTPQAPIDPWSNDEIDNVVKAWELSGKEKEELILLGERLRDIDHHKNEPDMVLRFIKARRTIDQAETMFRNMIQWRLDNKVDTILHDYIPPRLIRDLTPGAVLDGYTSAGDPIYVERLGSADQVEMVRRYGEEHLLKHAIWIREQVANGDWIKEYETRQGRKVRQIVIVQDLKGLSTAQLDRHLLDAYQKIMRLDQDNYPEVASKILAINAPFILRLAWSLVKHFFDHNVAEKMVFASTSHTHEVLEQHIGDLTVLPKEVVPEGRGKAAKGLNNNFQGGKLPPEGEEDEEDLLMANHQQRKETATTVQDDDGSDDIDVDIDIHSVSGLSTKTYLSWARPLNYMRQQEMKKAEQKEAEIRQVRQMAAERIVPKQRSAPKQARLMQLREAQAKRRRFQEDPVSASTMVVKEWSEKLTDRLGRHGQMRRFFNMSTLLLLFFALLNPEIVEFFSGINMNPINSDLSENPALEHSVWLSLYEACGLFAYLLVCALIHFGVCDIALVYSFLTLKLGSRTGREMKKFYSEKVRMAVAGMSIGIFTLSFARPLSNIMLSLLVSGLSKLLVFLASQAKERTGAVWTMIAEKWALIESEDDGEIVGELETFGEMEAYNTTNDALINATETGTERVYFSRIKSFVVVDDVETAVESWQANAFETARLLFSYTSVFLLVFLFLFNQTASSQLVKTINDKGKKESAVHQSDDDSMSQVTDLSTITPLIPPRTRSTGAARNTPTPRDEQSVLTQSTSGTPRSRKKRFRMRRKIAAEAEF